MIRQAHTYLVGAMGGATLIAIAIAVFVVLVSAQVFRDWPIPSLGGGADAVEVSDAKRADNGTGGAGAATAGRVTGPSGGAAKDEGRGQGTARGEASGAAAIGGVDSTRVDVPGGSAPSAPASTGGGQGGGEAQNGGGAGRDTGSAQSPSGVSSSAGNAGTTGSGGGSSGAPPVKSGSEGSSGSAPLPTTTGQVAETVNNTVNQVDEAALGGTLDKAGVTGVTEGVVNGVVGPESTVGKVVDETVGAVNGILGGKR